MRINLTEQQEAWFSVHVARGDFSSVEEAARQLIDERIAERFAEARDDLAWAKPFVDEALAEVERGEVMSRAEFKKRADLRLSQLKD